jgi:hypothetical protein
MQGALALLALAVTGATAFSAGGPYPPHVGSGLRRAAIRLRGSPQGWSKERPSSLGRAAGAKGARCLTDKAADKAHNAVVDILRLAACTNRGQSATVDQKYEIENAISDLENSASIVSQMGIASDPMLNGKWYLVYATERETRSSPFFWAFRKALKGVEQPVPVLPSELAESFFAITDGLPFYSVGRATQTISGVGTGSAKLVSSVQVKIRSEPIASICLSHLPLLSLV